MERQTGVRSSAPMDFNVVPVDGFDVWDAVVVNRTLYVKAGPDEAATAERTRAVLAQLQSQPSQAEPLPS